MSVTRTGTAVGTVVLLLTAGAVALGGTSAAAQTLTVGPADAGANGVRGGSEITVSGTVPAAPRAGLLEALAGDGRVLGDLELNPAVFRDARPSGDYVDVDGGSVQGRLTLSGLFSGPVDGTPVRSARLVLCADDDRGPDGRLACRTTSDAGRTTSNGTRVDYTRPFVRGYELVAVDRVRVVFSEPVRNAGGDDPLDWQVTDPDRQVLEVEPSTPGDCRYLPGEDSTAGTDGCTRTLRLDRPVGEDVEPRVVYVNAPFPGRLRYQDLTGNFTAAGPGRQDSNAVDLVRPALPTIDRVGGRDPDGNGRAAGTSSAPVVDVSGLTAGHVLTVTATAEDGSSVSSGAVPAEGATTSVPLPALPPQPDGVPYRVAAVVVDPHGNRSEEPGKRPGRADGGPAVVSYVVDAAAPQLVSAVPGETRDVVVVFSELVTGTDDPSSFTITTPEGARVLVLGVSGSGDRRTLSTVQRVPDGSLVTYAPSAGRYVDRAGNPVPNGTAVVNGLDLPVVTDPAGPVVVPATTYTVRGTAEAGAQVELYRDAGDDGSPDGEALARVALPAGETAFALVAPLTRDAANDLVVLVRDAATGATRTAPVARITQDSTAPTASPTAPAQGAVLAGGSTQEVRFSYEDANPGSVRLELTLDGSRWTELSGGAAPGQPFRFVVPTTSTDRAQVRTTPRDAAGNLGERRAGPVFEIDAVPPTFTARTVDPRTVRVVLAEPGLSGSSSAADWQLDGEPVGAASESRGPGGETVVLLTPRPGRTLAPDATPVVRYAPTVVSAQYRDRAGQPVPEADRRRTAVDGIAPAAPVVSQPSAPVLTAEGAVQVRGTAEPDTLLDLVDAAGRFAAARLRVAADGTWSVAAQLQPDAVSDLRAVTRDAEGNTSPQAVVPTIEQDATAPTVRISAPAPGSRLEPGSRATVTWTSADRNPVDGQTLVEISTDAGRTWIRAAQQQPRSGSTTIDVPDVRTGEAQVRVTVPDRVARRGVAVSGPIGIGQAAATPTPSPTASASPPVPGLPPLGTYTGVEPGRLLDTRDGTGGRRAAVGPGDELRLQVAGREGVPARGAAAVVVNLTAVQASAKTHIGIVPTGADTEATASLTVPRGGTVANLVTVRLGPDGGLDLRNEAGAVHLVVDVLGWYAADDGPRGAPFTPLSPERLLDTREGTGAPRGQLPAGRTLDLQVTGRGGVPASGVTSVVLGLAAVGPTRATHVTAWAAGRPRPETSNLNVEAGSTRANQVTVPVGPDGRVSLAAFAADVHLVADVFGWYGPAAATVAVPLDPARVLDTRTGDRRPASADRDLVLQVAGRGGVPREGAQAVVLLLTAVAPSASTHVTAYAGGSSVPGTANLNALRGSTVTSQVTVPVGPDGTVRLAVGTGRVHLVADVAGWFRAP